ncbi:MAG TPA: glycosyltransferase family 2 protein [Armatimonadota bacterium]|jgi:hypothetical protein
MTPLDVVIVTYNVRELLLPCLDSLDGPSPRVIVVDNASADGTVEALRSGAPQVMVLANTENVGFARANNQALRLVAERYVCLLNPDTVVRPGALARLVETLEAHPTLGLVGPKLLNPDGSLQSAGLRFPTLGSLAGQLIPWERRPRRPRASRGEDGGAVECDWVIGACMVMRRELLDQVGLLDETYFMYGEEKDLCYRAKQAGWGVACVPSAEVIHYGGQSAEQVPVQSYLAYLDSQFHFLGKFYAAGYRWLFGATTWIGCGLRRLGGLLLSRIRPTECAHWRQKAEVARAGAQACAAHLWGRHRV